MPTLIRDVGVEMATNMALKRARKAQRRKQVVAEKRKLEVFTSSLEGMVRRAAALPIQHCLLTEAIFENGLGIRDAVAWSQSKGFPPHREFAVAERILADVSPDPCGAVFQFGRDGKPFYMPGPKESVSLIRRRLEQAVAARLLEDESAREAAEIDDASDSTDPLGLLRAG